MVQTKEKSRMAFNHQAATYDKDIKGQHARNLYPVLLEKLSSISYDTFLDLGCGTGAVLQSILEKDSSKKAYGLDLSENMLQKAKEKLNNKANLILGDSDNLPFENDFFDVVYCNDSFHHYPSPQTAISEVCRVLKPEGTFIICDCWQPFLSRTIMNFYMKFSNEGDVKMYSEKEICGFLSPHFKNVVWEKINYTSYMAYGSKHE